MSSDNDTSDASAGSHGDVHENSTDQDSLTSGSDGLVPSDGSHMGSVSVDSIDSDSITDPLVDGFVDQPQQKRGGGGLNLAEETEILGSEFGTEAEDPIINSGAIGEEWGLGTIPKGRSIAYIIFNKQSELCFSLNDWDSADYLTTIHTNQYYLRIFCWVLDRVIHAAYVVVYFLIKSDI
jgi:hypothetical protein